ncbi:DUF2535 family protein [Bacillus sp. FJAT-45350]|uniref:DUF2535 family protein n=1 Tax=Bacillus sp. FJAT-45350 TaxID=2011014 RepID=UPI000BB92CD3|nr:DUF2535 family protein [Bacillus sp. FJAT-45350]
MKKLDLYHRSGVKYSIINIPTTDESKKFFIEYQLQKFIDDIESESKLLVEYCFTNYLEQLNVNK